MATCVELKIIFRDTLSNPTNSHLFLNIIQNMDRTCFSKILTDELECETKIANIDQKELHLELDKYDQGVKDRLAYLCESGIFWRLLKSYLRKSYPEICSHRIIVHFQLVKTKEEASVLYATITFEILDETTDTKAMDVKSIACLQEKTNRVSEWFYKELECLVQTVIVGGEQMRIRLVLHDGGKDAVSRLYYLCDAGLVTTFLNNLIGDASNTSITKVIAQEMVIKTSEENKAIKDSTQKTAEYKGNLLSLMFYLFFPDHKGFGLPAYTEKNEYQYHEFCDYLHMKLPMDYLLKDVDIITNFEASVELDGRILSLVPVIDESKPGYCRLYKRDSQDRYFTTQDAFQLVLADSKQSHRKRHSISECNPSIRQQCKIAEKHSQVQDSYPVWVRKIALALPWPKSVENDFLNRITNSHWPSREVLDKMVKEGCHATATKILEESSKEWELSFSSAKKHLELSLCNNIKTISTVLKVFLLDTIGLAIDTITKTSMFWLMEENGENAIARLSLSELWDRLLEKLICFLCAGDMPDYFITSYNLLRSVSEETQTFWLLKANYIRYYPIDFMNIFWTAHKMKDISGKLDWGEIFSEFLKRMPTGRSLEEISSFLIYVYQETVKYHILNRNHVGILNLCHALNIGNRKDNLLTLLSAYKDVLERLYKEKQDGHTLSLVLSDCANLCHQAGIVCNIPDMITLAGTLHEKAYGIENRHHSVDINFVNFLKVEKKYKDGINILRLFRPSPNFNLHCRNMTSALVYSSFVDKVVCDTLGVKIRPGKEVIVPIQHMVLKLYCQLYRKLQDE